MKMELLTIFPLKPINSIQSTLPQLFPSQSIVNTTAISSSSFTDSISFLRKISSDSRI